MNRFSKFWFAKQRERGEPLWLWGLAAIGGLAILIVVGWGGWQLWSLRTTGSLALGLVTEATQPAATSTPTPDEIAEQGDAQAAMLPGAEAPALSPANATALAQAATVGPGTPTPVPPRAG